MRPNLRAIAMLLLAVLLAAVAGEVFALSSETLAPPQRFVAGAAAASIQPLSRTRSSYHRLVTPSRTALESPAQLHCERHEVGATRTPISVRERLARLTLLRV